MRKLLLFWFGLLLPLLSISSDSGAQTRDGYTDLSVLNLTFFPQWTNSPSAVVMSLANDQSGRGVRPGVSDYGLCKGFYPGQSDQPTVGVIVKDPNRPSWQTASCYGIDPRGQSGDALREQPRLDRYNAPLSLQGERPLENWQTLSLKNIGDLTSNLNYHAWFRGSPIPLSVSYGLSWFPIDSVTNHELFLGSIYDIDEGKGERIRAVCAVNSAEAFGSEGVWDPTPKTIEVTERVLNPERVERIAAVYHTVPEIRIPRPPTCRSIVSQSSSLSGPVRRGATVIRRSEQRCEPTPDLVIPGSSVLVTPESSRVIPAFFSERKVMRQVPGTWNQIPRRDAGAANFTVGILQPDLSCLTVSPQGKYHRARGKGVSFLRHNYLGRRTVTQTTAFRWFPSIVGTINTTPDPALASSFKQVLSGVDLSQIEFPVLSDPSTTRGRLLSPAQVALEQSLSTFIRPATFEQTRQRTTSTLPPASQIRYLVPINLGARTIPCRISQQEIGIVFPVSDGSTQRTECLAVSSDFSSIVSSQAYEILTGPTPKVSRFEHGTLPTGVFAPAPLNPQIRSLCVSPYTNFGLVAGIRNRAGDCVGLSLSTKALITVPSQFTFDIVHPSVAREATIVRDLAYTTPTQSEFSSPVMLTGNSNSRSANNGSAVNLCNGSTTGYVAQLERARTSASVGGTVQVAPGVMYTSCMTAAVGVSGTVTSGSLGGGTVKGAIETLVSSSNSLNSGASHGQLSAQNTVTIGSSVGASASGTAGASCETNSCGVVIEKGFFAGADNSVNISNQVAAGGVAVGGGVGTSAGLAVGGTGGFAGSVGEERIDLRASVNVKFLIGINLSLNLSIDNQKVIGHGAQAVDGVLYLSAKVGDKARWFAFAMQDGSVVAASEVSKFAFDSARRTADGVVYAAQQVAKFADGSLRVLGEGASIIGNGTVRFGHQVSSFAQDFVIKGSLLPVGVTTMASVYRFSDITRTGAFALIEGSQGVLGRLPALFDDSTTSFLAAAGRTRFIADQLSRGASEAQSIASNVAQTQSRLVEEVRNAAKRAADAARQAAEKVGNAFRSAGNAIRNFLGF
jgi:hypothetical protein